MLLVSRPHVPSVLSAMKRRLSCREARLSVSRLPADFSVLLGASTSTCLEGGAR